MLNAVARLEPLAVEILTDLISAPSLEGQEGECQTRIAQWMRRLGGEVSDFQVDDQLLRSVPGYIEGHCPYRDRPNVVARWHGIRSEPSLIINSHIDVVETGDLSQWTSDPWEPRVYQGKVYGRGAADAKGCLCAALLAIAAVRDQSIPFGCDLVFESVIDEEATGNGTLECLRRGIIADAAIVLEPTSLEVCTGHRGLRGLRIAVKGEAAHAGTSGGRSAIRLAARLIDKLEALNVDWKGKYRDAAFSPPRLNVGTVTGGDNIYIVPDHSEFQVGIRYAPDQISDLLSDVKGAIDEVCDHADMPGATALEEFYFVDDMPSYENSRFVQLLSRCARKVRGRESAIQRFPAACDARHFARFDIPTAIFGPGTLGVAHGADEFVELAEIVAAAQTLALVLTSSWNE
jgi:acetylornithine deacetylase